MRLYYDQGECVALRAYQSDVDEIQEVVTRLTTVTDGCEVCVTVIVSCHVTVMLLNSCKSTNTTIVCHINGGPRAISLQVVLYPHSQPG